MVDKYICTIGKIQETIEANNENEAKSIFCDICYEVYGLKVYTDEITVGRLLN